MDDINIYSQQCYELSLTDNILQKNSSLIDDFLFSLYGKSENTQKTYATILKQFTLKTNHIKHIMPEHIEQYIYTLKNKYKPSSVNLAINAIKSYYNFAAEKGHKNMGKYIKTIPVLPPEQRVLTKDEYIKVCARVKNINKLDCFKFLCNTGCRVSEFVSLRSNNVSNGFLRIIGKGRKNRSIPMNSTAKEIYSRNPNFEMIKRKNRIWVFRLCRDIAKEAEIPEFHPHSCRHYFSNELYHHGVPMHTISRLLGHSSTLVTENVYIHWSEESLAGSTDVLV